MFVFVLCSKCLSYVNALYSQTPLYQEGTADETIGVKKGGIYVVFQPPFLSVQAVSILVLVVCNM